MFITNFPKVTQLQVTMRRGCLIQHHQIRTKGLGHKFWCLATPRLVYQWLPNYPKRDCLAFFAQLSLKNNASTVKGFIGNLFLQRVQRNRDQTNAGQISHTMVCFPTFQRELQIIVGDIGVWGWETICMQVPVLMNTR